jgi:transposase
MDIDLKQPLPSPSPEEMSSLPLHIQVYIRFLEEAVIHLRAETERLHNRVKDLEARLSKNSSNSSKPPSSDGMKKPPKSQRGNSGKKPGGQLGHPGKSLSQVSDPDVVVNHIPDHCHDCGTGLNEVDGVCVEKRQVFDLPPPKVQVTEHRVEEKVCPCCGKRTRAHFPDEVRGHVQYGERVQALATYFANVHFIPVERLCEIMSDIFGVAMSSGTCSSIDARLFKNLEPFEKALKAYLVDSTVLHFDESGMRCKKKLHWVHVASSQMATLYTIHSKRGREAMDEADILPRFQGVSVHDCWMPYFSFEQISHGLCNAHHLRELTFVYEELKEAWAKRMKDLLLRAKRLAERHTAQKHLPQNVLQWIEGQYNSIIEEGLLYHLNLPPLQRGERGRQKQRVGKNLLDRLKEHRSKVLRFVYDFSVPFTNNQGEQDIRMVKVKQKVSGCFRTLEGAKIFCRIRSYISTARKQGWNIWKASSEAIRGFPRMPSESQQPELQVVIA